MPYILSKLTVFICFLCCANGRVVEDIEGDVATLKILTTMRKSTLQVKTLQIRE